jgi:hypothetical protein
VQEAALPLFQRFCDPRTGEKPWWS